MNEEINLEKSVNKNPQLLEPIELYAIKKSTEITQLPIINPIKVESHDKTKLNEELHKNPCINFLPQLEFEVSDACWGKSNGEIAIQSISGGDAPYLVSLQDSTDFQSASNLNLLRAGTYRVWLKDQKGCVALFPQEIEVDEKHCTTEYSIKPNFNEKWTIPLKSSNSNAQLTIISFKGQVVEQISIRNGLPKTWNGRAKNGADLPMGSYSFILKYSDGTMEQGSISIVK
ncbi:MAG: hypothetical protein ACI81T_001010 [Bacteroidia bacterium]